MNKNKTNFCECSKTQIQKNKYDQHLENILINVDKFYSEDGVLKLKNILTLYNEKKKKCFYGKLKEEYSSDFTKIKNLTEDIITFEIKDSEGLLNRTQLNVIKVKNCLCKLLYNTYSFKDSFLFENEKNLLTKEIIVLINKANSLKYTKVENSNEITWCLNVLNDLIELLPNEYIENNYSLLYEELLRDLNIEKRELIHYYTILSTLNETIRNVEKRKEEINSKWKSLKEENITQIIRQIIMENNTFYYSTNIVVKKGNISFILKMKYKYQKGKNLLSFCEDFPNLNQLFNKPNRKPFEVLKNIYILDILKIIFIKIKKSIIDSYFIYE